MRVNLTKLAGIGIVLLFCTLFCPGVVAQNVQFTQGSVGSGLDNTIQIPIAAYPGRGGASLPVTLYYSSRVWRLDNLTTLVYQSYYQSVAQAIYAEYSTAGWKTSLDLPIIEWPKTTDTYYYSGGPECIPCGGGFGGYRVRRVYIHMPDGSRHELRQDDIPRRESIVKTGTFYAVDSSRLRYDSTGDNTGTLYLPDGSRYVLNTGTAQFIDRNGNTLNYDASTRQWTDTLGRLIGVPLPADPSALAQNADGTRTFTYTAKGLENTNRTYTLVWKNLADAVTPDPDNNNQTPTRLVVGSEYLPNPNQLPNTTTNKPVFQSQGLFNDDAPDEGVNTIVIGQVGKWAGQGQVFNPVVLAEVRLPNNLSYKFSYNIYGEIDKVTYPTGAYETYRYTQMPSIGDNSVPYTQANRGVNRRQLSPKGDGSGLETWTYASTGAIVTTTAPDNSVTETYRHSFAAPQHGTKFLWAFGFEDARNGMVYDERVKVSANGAILRRKLTQWEQTTASVPPRPNAPISGNNTEPAYRNPRPAKEVSIVLDTGGNALAKTETYSYDPTYQLTTGLDMTSASEFNFAEVDQATAQTGGFAADLSITIAQGTLARTTETAYLTSAAYRDRNILGLPTSVIMRDAVGNVVAKTETFYDEFASYSLLTYGDLGTDYTDPLTNARGLVTTVRRYTDLGAGLWLEAHVQYDQCGSPRVSTNERGVQMLTDYASTYKHAYATQTTTAAPDPSGQRGSTVGLTATSTFDYTTGLVLSTTDANGQTTSYSYRDEQNNLDQLNRLRKVTRADGGWTKYGFNDVVGDLYTFMEVKQDDTHTLKTYKYFDALGRASRSFLREGLVNNADSYIVSDSKYDKMGRVCGASNPYRTQTRNGVVASAGDCNWSANWTATTYDVLGRVKQVTLPDGTSVQTDYVGIYTTMTDQAGKQRRQKMDALGRLVRVDEPDLNGSLGTADAPNQSTTYSYDTLGNLVRVQQGSGSYVQNRYFKYDAVSRLTYEKQVEQASYFTASDSVTGNSQWSRHIVYDENGYQGLVTSQYDARNVHTSFSYDNLNRLTGVSYNDGVTPSVSYFYDVTRFTNSQDARPVYNLGRQVEVQTAALGSLPATSQGYNYDQMGRVANSRQGVGANYYSMIYQYNQGGALKSEQYPSGRLISYDYDDASRLASLSSGATTYASQFNYDDPRGLLSSFVLGNGAVESYTYNSRLQPSSIQVAKNNTVLERYEYKFGQVNPDGSVDETKNNGQIGRIEGFIGAVKQWQQRFGYDSLGRLSTASEYRGDNGQLSYLMTYEYDTFGNRYQKQAANSSSLPYAPVEDGQINKLTNRFTAGITDNDYDAAGNVLRDPKFTNRQYLYDANNRQRQVSQLDGTGAVTSVYDGAGQRVATMIGASIDNVLVYDAGGKLVAEYGQESVNRGTSYVVLDHQSSVRVVMDSTGAVISRHDYQPYGGEIGAGIGLRTTAQFYGQADSTRQRYAGMETDDGGANGHTLWRKYDSSSGRWTSPDPYAGSMTIADPQSFNRYTYVNDDPVNLTDPSGLMPSDVGVFQTDDPEDAKIARQQSLRDLQTSVNADYAARHGGTVSYEGNRASFTSASRNTQRQWLFSAMNAAIDSNSSFHGIEPIEGDSGDVSSSHAQDVCSLNATIVVIWDPIKSAKHPFSIAGHVSYITIQNDTSYSWEGNGALYNQQLILSPSSRYTDERSTYSAGRGYILDFGPRLNEKFQNALINAYENFGPNVPYGPINNNCGKAFNVAINAIRKELNLPASTGIFPYQIRGYIKNVLAPKGYVKREKPYPMQKSF